MHVIIYRQCVRGMNLLEIYILCIYIYILRTYVYTYIHTYMHTHTYTVFMDCWVGGWKNSRWMDWDMHVLGSDEALSC